MINDSPMKTTSLSTDSSFLALGLRRATEIPDDVNPIELYARIALWAVLVVLAWTYIPQSLQRSQVSPSFVHFVISRVNLVFHEAGHILFMPLGQFMMVFGGSLLQVLVPLLCTAAFLFRHGNAFGASVTLWWTGQSLIGLAPYIADARSQELVLLGGVTGRDSPGYHDWNNLLRWTGLLFQDVSIARFTHLLGAGFIVLALAWGAFLLWKQRCRVKERWG